MKDSPLLNGRTIIRLWLATWGLYFVLNAAESFIVPTNAPAYAAWVLLRVIFWVGSLLTVLVLILLYRGKVDNSKFNPRWIMYGCVGAWATYLLVIGSGRFIWFSNFSTFVMVTAIQIAGLLTLPALAVAFLGLSKQNNTKEPVAAVNYTLARIVAGLVVAALVVGTYAAIRTLWTPIEDGKFVYNNLANGLGCGAVALVILLSYLQRDVYWLSRGRSLKLDERQTKERQQVFETSYKIGTTLVFAAFYVLFEHRHSLPTLIQHDSVTPGNILWPFANLVLVLFALPLLVAAYKQRRA